tara:strand:- start:61 stop:507 length:447 start_codon:yes stop_codon:yes gene_type:complete
MVGTIATVRFPGPGPYATKVFINNASGYAATTTSALTVDDTARSNLDVRDVIAVGQEVYAKNNANGDNMEFLGNCTATGSATAITFNDGTGLRFAVVDNQELYVSDPSFMAQGIATKGGYTAAGDATDLVTICWSPRNELCYTFMGRT